MFKPLITACAVSLGLAATAVVAQQPKSKVEIKKAETKKVDVNTATAEELEALPQVGPVNAKKIIDGRPYASVGDLQRVLNERALEAVRPLVVASRPAPAKAETKRAETKPESKKAEPAKEATKKVAARPAEKAVVAPSTGGTIDLNTADAATLEELPGIGPALAKAIIDGRPYKSVDELDDVKGIGPAKLAQIKPKVRVGAAHAGAPAAKAEMKAAAKGSASKAAGKKPTAGAGGMVNINTASRAELETLTGIGPVKAQAIIDARPFRTIEEVMKVRGIKEETFSKIKDHITVN